MQTCARLLPRVCALCATLTVAGQVWAAPPVPPVRPMYFEHLTMRDGLSQSTVMSILQDSQGFLWLATESGLDRFDGYSIREYRRARGDEHALASDYIWTIAEDAHGDLWLATVGGGVARHDRRTGRFQLYRHDPADPSSLASDTIRTLIVGPAGKIWVGHESEGLDLLDPGTGLAQHFRHRDGDPHSLPADAVFALYADRRGRIWVGTDRGLVRYDPARDGFINVSGISGRAGISGVRIRAICEDHEGALWVGTLDGGLSRLDPQTGRATVFRHDPDDPGSLSNDRVRAILEDDARRLWVATADGLNLFDRRTGRFVHYKRDADNPQSLRDDDVMSLYQDRSGVLWVGTRAGGASHWNPRSWALGHYRSNLLRATAVNAFADDGTGTVWVGTANGLVEIDTKNGRERRYGERGPGPLVLPDQQVMALLYDHRGALWIGTMRSGLLRFDPSQRTVRAYRSVTADPASIPAEGIMALYEDRNGDIWVGTFGGGLARIDGASGRLMRYPVGRGEPDALSSPRASAIVEDTHGNLWIGTVGGGLNLLDRRSGHFYHYRRSGRDPHSLSDDRVYALHVDRDGQLWVGTAGGGLDRLIGSSHDPQSVRFENQSALTNMPSQVVYGIESDAVGRLWLSTNKGLVRFDPHKRTVRVFREAQGLQAEEFNFNAHYRGRDGTLYFGGNNGFNAFQPDAAIAAPPPPRVVLTAASILNRALEPQELPGAGRPLELAYDDKLVSFVFSALDFTSPANNHYLYRLEGFDSDWIDAGNNRRAVYTNLDPGRYVFRVRAANADGVWNEAGLAIPVRVRAAPWNTTAARTLYAAMALLVLAFLWRAHRARRERELRYSRELEEMVHNRTRELEQRNSELQVLTRAKSDFLARMSHELRTPMNGVLGMSELLLDMRLEPGQRRFVESIHRCADSLLAIVDDVLDFSKIEAGRLVLDPVDCDLTELVEQTAEMLAPRAAAKGVELLCDSPSNLLPRVRADVVRLRQVLVNLGGNAVKFTEKGEVILRLISLGADGENLRVRLEVADTGIGIDPEHQSRIFDEFAQGDASTTRRFGGTGLGLSIVRQLIELMGGRLEVQSAPGVGSTFSLELELPLSDPAAGVPTPLSDVQGLRVLVVERNDAARGIIVRALHEWGADAIGVASIAEALDILRMTACNAIVLDDPPSDALGELNDVLGQRAAQPRIVRLKSVLTLVHPDVSESQRFDVELTKPLRLLHLYGALSGQFETFLEGDVARAAESGSRVLRPLRGRVLVVDDQQLNLDVAGGMLRSLGVEVHVAMDGREALAKLETSRYDVVLMDCQMPVMDGFSATAELRRREGEGEHVPVIALTADATSAGREACFSAGMDDYIGKPFRRAMLYATLSRWLSPREEGDVSRTDAAWNAAG